MRVGPLHIGNLLRTPRICNGPFRLPILVASHRVALCFLGYGPNVTLVHLLAINLVRLTGSAPMTQPWQGCALLLRHNRKNSCGDYPTDELAIRGLIPCIDVSAFSLAYASLVQVVGVLPTNISRWGHHEYSFILHLRITWAV